jgi:hypothetical protein
MNTSTPSGFVPCTIRFTAGTLAGIEIPQNLPASLAVVGREVKKPCAGSSPYIVIAVR